MTVYRGPYSLRHRSLIEYPNPFVPDAKQNSSRAQVSRISKNPNADSSAGGAGQHARLQYFSILSGASEPGAVALDQFI